MPFRIEGARADSLPLRYADIDTLDHNYKDVLSAINAISVFLREDQVGNRSKYFFQILDAETGAVVKPAFTG